MTIMISLVLGGAGTVASVVGFQLKKQKHIVFSQFLANLLVALSYLALEWSKMAGGLVCLLGAIQSLITFLFLQKGKDAPKALPVMALVCYAAATLLTIVLSGSTNYFYDLLPLMGSFCFALGIGAGKESISRRWFFVNTAIWILYDCLAAPIALANLVTHLLIMISVVLGIVRYDILKKNI